jgi:hypothetical protein
MDPSHVARLTDGGPSPSNFPLKNNSVPEKSPLYLQITPLSFCEIKPWSMNFQEDPWIFENNFRYTPSHFQKLQISPQNSFCHIFATTTLILAILAPKFSESFTRSSYAFI